MKIKRTEKVYLIIGLLIIILSAVGLKNYSDTLRREGQKELSNSKNRTVAIEKIRFAQTIWPLLRLDKPYQNSLDYLKIVEQRPAVIIFLESNTNTTDIDTLVLVLKVIPGVKQVQFVSKEDALKRYSEITRNDPQLLELVTANILPESIEVFLDDFTIRDQVEKTAKSKSFVTDVVQSV